MGDISPCDVADLKLNKWYWDSEGYFRRLRGPKLQCKLHEQTQWYLHHQDLNGIAIYDDMRIVLRLELYLFGLNNINPNFGVSS